MAASMKMASFCMVEVNDVSEALAASIIRVMSKPHTWNQFELQEPVSQGTTLARPVAKKVSIG
jgi:hypothetical protein